MIINYFFTYSFIADFKIHKGAEPPSRKIKLVRYQQNPERNWGPKPRASGKRKS
jgi:tRNA (guanine26-N2/guanine27-N2)-dimethyltransferase